MKDPAAGDVMQGTGGLRKLRLFTLYAKNETTDLTSQQRNALKAMIKAELEARRAS